MSGEYDKCSEHPVDCKCQEHAEYFYKGKFYSNEEEFFKASQEYAASQISEEDFYIEMHHLAKDIWINLKMQERYFGFKFNGEYMYLVKEFLFLEFIKYIHRKFDTKQEKADG